MMMMMIMIMMTVMKFGASSSCEESDQKLMQARDKVCASLVPSGTNWCKNVTVTADKDWPSQAVYMQMFLDTLISEDVCLNTSTAQSLVSWLDETQSDKSITGNFAWTWQVFQVHSLYISTFLLFTTLIESIM